MPKPTLDSLRELSCRIKANDQLVRDSLIKAWDTNDSLSILKYSRLVQKVDSLNFKILESIIINYGFPSPKWLGKGACTPVTVLFHWSKEFPEWFNSPALVTVLRQQIVLGNLPLWAVDMAHYLYVNYMDHAMLFFELINQAREEYGLEPYTEKQFLKEEAIYPID